MLLKLEEEFLRILFGRSTLSNGIWLEVASRTTRVLYSASKLVSRCFVYHTHGQVVASVITAAAARGREPLESVDSPRWSWEHSLLFL